MQLGIGRGTSAFLTLRSGARRYSATLPETAPSHPDPADRSDHPPIEVGLARD